MQKNHKNRDENVLLLCVSRSTRGCKSQRSRQELSIIPTNIWLQESTPIHPRTSLSKLWIRDLSERQRRHLLLGPCSLLGPLLYFGSDWVAKKDAGWIQISNLFEFSNLHRNLNFRTHSVMKYRKSENRCILGKSRKKWSKFNNIQQNSGKIFNTCKY